MISSAMAGAAEIPGFLFCCDWCSSSFSIDPDDQIPRPEVIDFLVRKTGEAAENNTSLTSARRPLANHDRWHEQPLPASMPAAQDRHRCIWTIRTDFGSTSPVLLRRRWPAWDSWILHGGIVPMEWVRVRYSCRSTANLSGMLFRDWSLTLYLYLRKENKGIFCTDPFSEGSCTPFLSTLVEKFKRKVYWHPSGFCLRLDRPSRSGLLKKIFDVFGHDLLFFLNRFGPGIRME